MGSTWPFTARSSTRQRCLMSAMASFRRKGLGSYAPSDLRSPPPRAGFVFPRLMPLQDARPIFSLRTTEQLFGTCVGE